MWDVYKKLLMMVGVKIILFLLLVNIKLIKESFCSYLSSPKEITEDLKKFIKKIDP